MSKHVEKYPGLYAACKRTRVKYFTALKRVRDGMSVADALAMPVRRYGRLHPIPLTLAQREIAYTARWMDKTRKQLDEALSPSWERANYRRAERKVRKQITASRDDTSPAHIRRLRAAYCEQFIRFGTLDKDMSKQLQDYAHECRSAKKHSQRVSNEPAAQCHDRENVGARNDSRGDANQIDRSVAGRIADFLRA